MTGSASSSSPEHVEQIPLPNAPLVTVLSQVRWPQVTQLNADMQSVAKELGRHLAREYPLYSQQHEVQVAVTSEGQTQMQGGVIHQFRSSDEQWTSSLSESFITLQTSNYTSRADFCDRLERVLESVGSVVQVPFVQRVGFRYVNRIDDPNTYAQLDKLVKSEVLGATARTGAELIHSISEALYDASAAKLRVRWAQLPPDATVDPTIEPSKERSWMLDLDAFNEGRRDFKPSDLAREAKDLSAVAYGYFRSVVTDEFVRVHGGRL